SASFAAPSVAQFRRSRGDIVGKAQRLGVFVPRAGMKHALDEQPGVAERPHGAAIARAPRVELSQTETIPAWPFAENFRNDRIEPGLEIRPGAVQDVVLDAVRISQADQPPSRPAYRSTEQQRYRRARFLIGIKTDFCPGGGPGARHQIKPLGQGEKAVV